MPNDKELQTNSINDILKLTDRISSIVHSLVSYSHAGDGLEQIMEPVNIENMIQESIRLVSLSHKAKQISFDTECAPDLYASGNYQKLQQVVVIILTNASDASDEGSSVKINASREGSGVSIQVQDFGHGIEDRIKEKIFDPFFTTKQAGEGTGLGLSLAYNIVREHGGNIEFKSLVGVGSKFTVQLPEYLQDMARHA
jgi:signal transduction histidine kinase